jgi:hypothetical protein
MQVIGQNDDGLDSEWLALAGRHERRPYIVKVFGQEFPVAFRGRDLAKRMRLLEPRRAGIAA